jgi:RND family efflux transporter MFP subunit
MLLTYIKQHLTLVTVVTIVIIGGVVWAITTHQNNDPLSGKATAVVARGDVATIVSVSGLTRSDRTAKLAFPTQGVVTAVLVKEGDTVTASSVLATLGSEQERAALADAEAELQLARAALSELLAGTRSESVAISSATVNNASAELARVTNSATAAVNNARRALYSADMVAKTTQPNTSAPAPTITGTYRCEAAGTYQLRIYTSNSQSGYSLSITGIETGTYTVSAKQPLPFGNCGLYVQLTPNVRYHDTTWTIDIPNSSGDSYITNKNALTDAEITASNTIATAREAYEIATKELALATAAPRSQSVTQAEARVAQAQARVNAARATLADRSIIAPFSGVITDVTILAGETAGTNPVITLLESNTFDVIARIPEIDITDITVGQRAQVLFDADSETVFTGIVGYIAPLPIEIDGVAYFEAKITLTTPPPWLRGGLNADIDIITKETKDTLRVPSRYVTTDKNVSSVQTIDASGLVATTTIEILFRGNDGYIAVTGVPEGTTIIAP